MFILSFYLLSHFGLLFWLVSIYYHNLCDSTLKNTFPSPEDPFQGLIKEFS